MLECMSESESKVNDYYVIYYRKNIMKIISWDNENADKPKRVFAL